GTRGGGPPFGPQHLEVVGGELHRRARCPGAREPRPCPIARPPRLCPGVREPGLPLLGPPEGDGSRSGRGVPRAVHSPARGAGRAAEDGVADGADHVERLPAPENPGGGGAGGGAPARPRPVTSWSPRRPSSRLEKPRRRATAPMRRIALGLSFSSPCSRSR